MDIPGKDTDVNINISGETQNLSATEKAVNSLRNAIANLGRSADGADDEVDDLEEEMEEAGAAGFEGAAGVSAFATASEAAEEAVDDLEDEVDDIDLDLVTDGGFDTSEIAELMDEAADTAEAFDDVRENAVAASDAVDDIGQTDFGDFGSPRTQRRTIADILPDDVDDRVDEESLLGIDPDALAETAEDVQSKFPSAFRLDDPGESRPATNPMNLAQFGFNVPDPATPSTQQTSLFDPLFEDSMSDMQETLEENVNRRLQEQHDAFSIARPGADLEASGLGRFQGMPAEDDMGDIRLISPMQARLFQQGEVADLAGASVSDFDINDRPSALFQRYRQIAQDVSEVAKAHELADLDSFADDEPAGTLMTRIFDSAAVSDVSKGDAMDILGGQNGKLFDQGKFQRVLFETLRRNGNISAEALQEVIQEKFSDEMEEAEDRRQRIREVSELFGGDDDMVKRAFSRLGREDDLAQGELRQLRDAIRASDAIDQDRFDLGAFNSGTDLRDVAGRDTRVDDAIHDLIEKQSELFDDMMRRLEGDGFDSTGDAKSAFVHLLTNDPSEVDPDKIGIDPEDRDKLDGFADAAAGVDLIETELLDEIDKLAGDDNAPFESEPTARMALKHFFTDTLTDEDPASLTTRLSELESPNAVRDRARELFGQQNEEVDGPQLTDRQIKAVENKVIDFKQTAKEEGFLAGGERDDDFLNFLVNADRDGGFNIDNFRERLFDKFTADVPPEGSIDDVRRKKRIAKATDIISRDETMQKIIKSALENSTQGRVTRENFRVAADRVGAATADVERMMGLLDEVGEDIFGDPKTAAGANRTERFPDTDIVEIDALNRRMFDIGTPAKREPLNRAIRNLQDNGVPLAEETVRAQLFQQRADTDSEEFSRLIGDVKNMIDEGQISFGSLFDYEETERELSAELSSLMRRTDIDDSAIDDLTEQLVEDISDTLSDESNEISTIDELFFDNEKRNLRDILTVERESLREYNTEWEEVIENAEHAVKRTNQFFRRQAAPDAAELEQDETLLGSTKKLLERVGDTRVRGLDGEEATRIDVLARRTIRDAMMDEIPDEEDIDERDQTFSGRIQRSLMRRIRDITEGPGLITGGIDTRGDAMEFQGPMGKLSAGLRKLKPELGITSANLGPLNVSLRNFGSVLAGLVTIIGPLVTLIGGLATGFVALGGAIGGVTAVGALGFFEQLESQFGGINNRMEAMEATFNAIRELGRDAISPLENTTLAGMAPSEFFQRSIQRSIQLLNHFARVFADIAEMDAMTNAIERISDALFEPNSQGDGATMLEAMQVATEKLVPVVADLTVFLIDNLPEFIIFMSNVADLIDGPVATALVRMIDLMSGLIKIGAGFIYAYTRLLNLILLLVDGFEMLGTAINSIPFEMIPGISEDFNAVNNILFGIGAIGGAALGVQAIVSVLRRLAGAITVVLNLYGRFLKMLTSSGSRLNRLGGFLANIGKSSGSATRAQTTLGQFGGGKQGLLARAGSRVRGVAQSGLARLRGLSIPSFLKGGGGRGQLTLVDLFGDVSKGLSGLFKGTKITSMLSRLVKMVSPFLKFLKLFGKFIPFLGQLLWLFEIYKILRDVKKKLSAGFLEDSVGALMGTEPRFKLIQNSIPHLSTKEAKRVAELQRQGRDQAAHRVVEQSEAEAFPSAEPPSGNTTINVTVDGDGKDEEEIANKTGRILSARDRFLDRHNGRRPGSSTR